MAIKGISSATVHVSDQEAALDFYTNTLGFEKRSDQPMGDGLRWLEVAPPGTSTVIILAKDYGDWAVGKVGTFTGLVLNTDDMGATYSDLAAKGVQFSGKPEKQDWGMQMVEFVDQDGNGYVLVGQ